MHDELVKRLRAQAVYLPEKFSKNAELLDVLMKAADAIEELQKRVPPVPHGRLIDADALEKEAQKRMLMCNKNDNQFQKPYEIMRAIALAPTIIPASGGKEDE